MMDVAVLAGGRSLEHEISLSSAQQVLGHLDRGRWRPWPVYIDTDGQWHLHEPDAIGHRAGAFERVATPQRPGAALAELCERGIELVFPVLHGRHGEDGTVQGMLELHDLAFVGSGAAASAVCMDKVRTRECLTGYGVPMVEPCWVSAADLPRADPGAVAAAVAAAVGFPCFCKIDVSGSSYGVARAAGPEDVTRFVERHRCDGRRLLAERAVVGEEISVPVLGNTGGGDLRPLPPVGIYPVDDPYFTPRAKYELGACEEVVPPRGLDDRGLERVREIAVLCHTSLICDGMSRTDMIVTQGGPVVLEVNTIPGLTATSLLPQSAAAVGIDFQRLLSQLLDYALERRVLA